MGVGVAIFASLVFRMLTVFDIEVPSSYPALVLGALLFVTAATAFGLVVSAFVRSQIAAVFATAIIVLIPTINFSGMMYPTSTLDGAAAVIGQAFPALYFNRSALAFSIRASAFRRSLPITCCLRAFVRFSG